MFHTLAWSSDTVTATLTELAPVPDEIISVTNARFFPPLDINLYAGVAYGTNMQRARLTTPRIRQLSPTFLRPIQASLIAANDANNFFFDTNPLRFRGAEEIVIEAIQNAGVNQRLTVIGCVGMGLSPKPAGDVYVIRGTGATTLVANTWTTITFTLDSQLPAGRYAVLLCEMITTNAQAVRMIFDQQYYRPGCPGLNAGLSRLSSKWYDYPLGAWGMFHTVSLPRIQVLANVADTAQEFYLHLVPMNSIP